MMVFCLEFFIMPSVYNAEAASTSWNKYYWDMIQHAHLSNNMSIIIISNEYEENLEI